MQSVDLKKRRRAVKIANAVNSIDSVPASESSKFGFKATSTRFKLCKYSVKMKKKLSISCSS